MVKVLIIDDDEVDRLAIKRALAKTDLEVEVTEAENAADGLELIKNRKFDCVLLDYRLPDKDGLEVLQEIVSGEIRVNTPFVMLTGLDDDELALKSLRAGAQDFLTKDALTSAQLARAIINAIERQEMISQNRKIRWELKKKADFMRAIDDTMADGLLVTDENGKILTINKSCLKIFGYTKSEMLGQNLKMLMEEKTSLRHEKGLKNYLKTGKTNFIGKGPIEVPGKRKNGKTFALEIVVNQVPEHDHFVFVGCLRDISERKKAEAATREAEEKLELIAENSADVIALRDQNAKVIYITPSIKKDLGYDPADVMGRGPWLDILHPDDKEKAELLKDTVYKQGKPFETDVRLKSTTGKYLWYESRAVPIKDNKGKVIASVTSSRNITEYKKAESEALQMGRIVEESLNEIYVFDPKTLKFIMVNRGARENLGYSMDELKNLTAVDLKPELTKKAFEDLLKPLRAGEKEKISFETRHKRKDGTLYDVEVFLQLSQTVEKPVFVAIIEDVTDKKAAANKLRQVQKMEAIGNLSGGIAHDFNNLLTAIQGSLQLLDMVEEDLTPDGRECLDIAIKASLRGGDLTHRLLAFSRKQNLKPSVVEVNNLVRELMPLFRRTIDESISIETHLMDKEAFVLVDTGEMESALLNLTVNARDAMPGGGLLTFEAEEVEVRKVKAGEHEIAPGNYVILSVSDNGSGMSPEVRDQVFEPFFTTKAVDKGTGLGLSMVYGFVKQSGGHVTVYSEPGEGTTFKLYLKTTQDRQTSKVKKKKPIDLSTKQSGVILLVEDDEGVRTFVAQALSAKGYTVLDVGDGPSALKVMDETRKIDMLLTDVVLPKGISGPDVGKIFEKKFPGLGIIYSSGYTGKSIEINGWLQNGDELLSKPYDLEVLFERVHEKMTKFKLKKKK